MGNKKLIVWFFIWVVAMIFLVFFTQPETRKSKLDVVSFDTTESAELYFKNVRSFYYNLVEEGNGNFDAYRFRSMYEDTLNFSVKFVIYNSWRQNLAFIRVDTNYTKLSNSDYLVSASADWKSSTMPDGQLDSIFVPDQYNESQFDFAKNVFLAVKAKNRIGLPHAEDTLWISDSDMVNLRKTLRDYFILVGKI